MTDGGQAPVKRPPRRPARRRRSSWGERAGLIFTAAVKVVGLLIAADQAFIKKSADPTAFALAAFMMAGAQGLDNFFGSGKR
jgi:hypothetical protein